MTWQLEDPWQEGGKKTKSSLQKPEFSSLKDEYYDALVTFTLAGVRIAGRQKWILAVLLQDSPCR